MFRLGLIAILFVALAAPAQPREEPLVDRVRSAIDRGVRYLRRVENGKNHWETNDLIAQAGSRPGGPTALALLALLNSGVSPTDPIIQRGMDWLRKVGPEHVYVVGLQTMVFAEVGDVRDKELIQRNVDWLLNAKVITNGQFLGWTYGADGGSPDNSNSQYALLGLFAGQQAGAKIDLDIWKTIRDYYRDTQSSHRNDNGGWSYRPARGRNYASILTMTIAGLCGLKMCATVLDRNQQDLQPDGVARNCGKYDEDDSIQRALEWLDGGARFRFEDAHTFYNCYGIERAGRLTGQRFLAGRDWYREGCEFLVSKQNPEDYWQGNAMIPKVVETSFAILFLSKGRTPILISKWAYGKDPGWNNKHNDARHLVEFASKEMFKRQPLAWQVYDSRRLNFRSAKERQQEVGALVESPIVYINGHTAPTMTTTQKQILKQYIEEGGFVLAEACCGKDAFYLGFKGLMMELFPDHQMRPIPPEHSIWRSWANIPPTFAPLEGLDLGCKTVVVLSPRPLAGYWEANMVNEGRGKDAFRLAGNIIAYATGMEPPKPRGTIAAIADRGDEKKQDRGFLKAAQLRHEGDWHPAPNAIRNLMLHLRTTEKIDVNLIKEELSFSHPDLFNYKFLYLHGRGRFNVSPEGLDKLRANLTTGGLLLADACCASPTFDVAFRDFAKQLFPNAKLEMIPPEDVLYSAELNGTRINTVKVRTGGAGAGFDAQPPALEGIKVDGRWVVIYSRYDLGCALEKHASGDCIGHDHESALKLATAAVLYLLKK